ncbi:MAG TPA: Mpo1-like protein [Phycisphaerae bacterium]|nr:Mpo1-like protein [Phycisphaerae bacterium]
MENPSANWFKRHRNATNFWLHMIGMPACFIAAPVLLIDRQGWLAIAVFVAGYALQFTGHLVEGNRSGEEVFIRRLISRRK